MGDAMQEIVQAVTNIMVTAIVLALAIVFIRTLVKYVAPKTGNKVLREAGL